MSACAKIVRVNRTRAFGAMGGLALLLALAFPHTSSAQEDPGTEADDPQQAQAVLPPADAEMDVRLKNASKHTVQVGQKVTAFAKITPYVPGEKIKVRFKLGGKVVKGRILRVRQLRDTNSGVVKLRSNGIVKPGDYRVVAKHRSTDAQRAARARSMKFHPTYPDLDPGNRNSKVAIFNRLLDRRGYHVSNGKKYSDATSRAVMAFRKVNNMDRSFNANPSIFRTLAAGKGGFKLNYPGAGRHVEVDISRQVMVLANHGKAQHIFHVSTGAPSTPSDKGHYRFYRRQPGYNSIGMYYSVYYNRGEAIHGYKSVPPYNASHGCIRNPIPNSKFIYDWVSLGMSIWVYA